MVTLGQVVSALQNRNLPWVPSETSVSALSSDELRQLLGNRTSPAEREAGTAVVAAANQMRALLVDFESPPTAVDWRDQGYVTRVKSQSHESSRCNSCVAFATIAAIESRVNILENSPNRDYDLSEAHLFFGGCGNCCVAGWKVHQSLAFCRHAGIAWDVDFPYTPIDQPAPVNLQPAVRLRDYSQVFTVAERKKIIARKGPMIASFTMHEDFKWYAGGIYETVAGDDLGDHSVAVIGYDDAGEFWVCKNSWGPDWGEGGFFRIRYGQCGIDTVFPFWDVDPDVQPVSTDDIQGTLAQVIAEADGNLQLKRCLARQVCGGPFTDCTIDELELAESVAELLNRRPDLMDWFCNAIA